MATEATFTVPSTEFPLGTVFDRLPGVTVELERIVPGTDVTIPYLWVRGTRVDDVEAAFAEHPGVRDIHLVDSVEDEYLLRVEWDAAYEGVLNTLMEAGVSVIEVVGTNEQWTFDVRADDRGDVAEFQGLCRERGIPVTLTALHALTPVETATEAAVTDAQREALVLAFQRGYFESPSEVTLAELGEELGVSQQAVSSRIKRGLRNILGETLSALGA
jgi:predicted DNA binding protein